MSAARPARVATAVPYIRRMRWCVVIAEARTSSALVAAVMALVAVTTMLPRRSRGIHRLAPLDESALERLRGGDRGWLLPGFSIDLGVRKQVSERGPTGRLLAIVGGVVVSAVVVGELLGAQTLVSLLAVSVVAVVVFGLRSRQRHRRLAAVRRTQVIEACGVLAADLRAGRTPQEALEGAASVCGELQVASAAARLGGDVAGALELAAESPGVAGLRALSAAWQVAERSGAAFAAIVERLADSLRADESVRRQVSAELAGTRSTARLLAGLPLFGTALGYGIGADPVAYLTGSVLGWCCLFAGLVLAALGLLWVERLAETCETNQ
ncbi:MAG TPA: type II secretion system F family protein [Kribbella sp.]